MEITLQRGKNQKDHCPGILTIGQQQFYTCEDLVREIEGRPVSEWKIYGKTAIPRGRYKVLITMSQRFGKKLPYLMDVPGFTGIRIHSGSYAEHTEGCILPGLTRLPTGVGRSRDAMAIIQPMIQKVLDAGEEVWLTIS